MSEKKTILVLSDHPLAPSGVGTQTKNFIETLITTGKYRFICFGGAIKHQNYEPQYITDPRWGEKDWVVYPVDGYGSPEAIRSILWTEKPNLLWFMTDPRFYGWLWQIENEVRPLVPMVYYHVWDNYPPPKYNSKWYQSTDVIASISKVTHDIVNKVAPDVENHYIPHAVDGNIFKKLSDDDVNKFMSESFPDHNERTIFFWNNRNARRKQSGTLVNWFNKFAEEVGPENVCLIMHTDPKDPNGQDLHQLIEDMNMTDGRIVLSSQKMPPHALSMMYNMADCTINISDAEGFGLATLESLSCGTPIIVNMTGGLQEQVTDGEEWFGIGIEPCSKALIGSQAVPYIFEDRISEEDFLDALKKMYNMTAKERDDLGSAGSEHVKKNYSFEKFQNSWINLVDDITNRLGSWDTRTGYKSWEIKEIS
jgi:glycosyltransferase involved in cell wall biosynthesis